MTETNSESPSGPLFVVLAKRPDRHEPGTYFRYDTAGSIWPDLEPVENHRGWCADSAAERRPDDDVEYVIGEIHIRPEPGAAECPAADPTVPTPTPTPTRPPTAQLAGSTMPPPLDAPDPNERVEPIDLGPVTVGQPEPITTTPQPDLATLAALIDEHSFQAPGYSEDAAAAVLAAGWRPPARKIEAAPTSAPSGFAHGNEPHTSRPGPATTRRAGAHLLACLAPHLDLIHLATTNGIPGGPRSEPALLELLGRYARDAAAAAGWSGDPHECWRCGGNPCECGTPGAPA